jgi:MFS family permease
MNFFVADLQTGFGPFIAVYLAANKWTQGEIGVALSIGTMAGLIGQVPAGALVDAMRSKRAAAAIGLIAVSFSALLFALFPSHLPVYFAEILHGVASCILTPAVAAISLGLVGHAALGERLGRNARFLSIGNGLAAGAMGIIGSALSPAGVFWLTAAFGLPALVSLSLIRPYAAPDVKQVADPFDWRGVRDLLADRRLLAFGGCVLMFHLSNAAMLPLAAADVTKTAGHLADVIVAACIMVPQGVVALMSPWVGNRAEVMGRRPLLVLGWSMLAVRGALMAFMPDPWTLAAIQTLGGISAAVFGVMLPLIAADLTTGSGRYNLSLGLLGLAAFVGATLSTALAGWVADAVGDPTAFITLALAGLLGTAMCRFVMPDTREVRPAVAMAE